MPKFSVIVPVYNTQNYLKRCLDSISNQSFKDFELIVVNDGSTDDSTKILDDYSKKDDRIKVIEKKNGGLSSARNRGVEASKGEFLLLVDSDDFIERDLLEVLNKNLDDEPDLIRFQIREVQKDEIKDYMEIPFDTVAGDEAFKKIVEYHFVENAWCYLYKSSFFKINNFQYEEGLYHEDFGLTPLVIAVSSKVKSIDYIGYNYVINENSIMTTKDYKKIKKKAYDFLSQYENLVKKISELDISNKDIFKSFLANSVIIKSLELKNEDYRVFVKRLRAINAFDNLAADTYPRKIKKTILKISPKLYYKVMR